MVTGQATSDLSIAKLVVKMFASGHVGLKQS